MARDYKHRANSTKRKVSKRKPPAKRKSRAKKTKQTQVPLGRWVLAVLVLVGFVYFLYSLSNSEPEKGSQKELSPKKAKIVKKVAKKSVKKPVVAVKKEVPTKGESTPEVQYDFYTLLPEAEFVIPDHEVRSIKRAERVGKAAKNRQYSVQVSSFRQVNDADSLKARLLLLGFTPKVEKAKVKGTTWYRVKMGPYQQIKSVDAIVARLKKENIGAMVTAVEK
ncbi:MAG: SPOR domain-containing protein [Methyloprofundus sp.]|nr:SPOR domain-containing protein [Methyloprofundus sp.]